MKYLLTLLLFCCGAVATAQTTLSGTIVDKSDKEPLIGVNVEALLAADTNSRTGTVTDLDGQFALPNLAAGNYIVRISYVGYDRISRTFTANGTAANLGTIELIAGANTLDAVVIEAAAISAQQRGDTIEFNARAFKTNPDASTEDLVQKMPGVSNADGTLKVNGEEVKRVLVDGKPFYGDDPAAALKNLPADVVDRIQILDQQSDQSRFTGFDDGNSVKTINIVTRPGRNQGYFGRAQAGYGTDDRYIGSVSLNHFKGARRLSLVGMSNNINQQNFTSEDFLETSGSAGGGSGGRGGRGGRGGGGNGGSSGGNNFSTPQQGGINTTNALGLNYTDEWSKKIKVTGSYFFNQTDNRNTATLRRSYITPDAADSALRYAEQSTNSSRNQNHRANLRLEYTIDSSNEIIFVPRLSFQDNRSDRQLTGTSSFGETATSSRVENRYNAHNFGYNLAGDLTYRHRFAKRGRTISIGFNGGANSRDGNGTLYSRNEYTGQDTALLNQRYNQDNNGTNLSANLSYTEPVGKRGQLLLTYQPSMTRSRSERFTYDRNTASEDTGLNNLLTNVYQNRYIAQRGGVGYRYSDSMRDFGVTLNAQTADLSGDQERPYPFTVDKTFLNLLPQANFNYKFSRTENLRITYRTTANTPSISQLQNLVDNSNPLLLRTGNPDLRQDYNHSINLRYGNTQAQTNRSFFVFANASLLNNYIGNNTFTATQDTTLGDVFLQRGSQLTRPVNLSGAWNAQGVANYAIPLKKLKSNFSLNAGIRTSRLPGIINGVRNESNNLGISGGTGLSSNISENLDFTLSFNGTYSIVNNSLPGREDYNYYNQQASLKLNYIFLDRFVLNTDFTNTLYNGLGAGFNQSYNLWNAALGYKFLKDKSLQLDLYAFDILGQNRSIARTVTESYVEDSQTALLQRFGMLRLTWRIRNYGGNAPTSEAGSERRPGGFGGSPRN
jgi:uncharacterized membrane protein YgcG